MSTPKPQNSFEIIYKDTYNDLLRFVIFKCDNLDDVNDIIQETYIELFKMMKRQKINGLKPFIIGIAKNKLKKYYSTKKRIENLFVSKRVDEEEMINTLHDDFNLENHILEQITKEEIWEYLKSKNMIVVKIFYLYYAEDIAIKEIANELGINESNVKNHLYRTLRELNVLFGKDRDENV